MRFASVLYFPIATYAAAKCCWANGKSAAPWFVPCNANASVSHCCGAGEACLDNGLCFTANSGVAYRGGCTNPTWPSGSVCGGRDYCQGLPNWANLFQCSNGLFWCGAGNFCSSDVTPYEFLSWPQGNVLGIASHTANQTSTTVTGSPSSTPSNTAFHCWLDICSTPPSSAISNNSSCSGKISKGVTIGIGFGLGLALLFAVITLGVLYVREKILESDGQSSTHTTSYHHEADKPVELSQINQPVEVG